jgi:hypothetical protein
MVFKISMEVTNRPSNRQGNNNGNMACKLFLGVFPIAFEVYFRRYYLFGNLKEVIIILLFAFGLRTLGILSFLFFFLLLFSPTNQFFHWLLILVVS